MSALVYAGVVAAGAATLLIEAYRNYNSSLTSIPFREHPILQNVEVAKLCTAREKNIGFVFYSLLYLVTYIVVLSSSEVYELLAQASAASEVGPSSDFSDGALSLLDGQYGKPIFISAAIISIFSIGALRPVESTMRSLAHRLAGVPRGVYAVIEDLHAIPFETFKVPCQQPLTDMFVANAQKGFENSYDKSQIPSILTALRAIDYLAPAVTGKQRNQHFPFTQLEKMTELSDMLEEKVDALKDLLKEEIADEEAARRRVFDAANGVANDTIALFGVHFLRNNRAIKNFSDKSAIALINERIKRGYQVELNSFAMGLMAACLAIGVAFFAYATWLTAASPITASGLEARVIENLQERGLNDEDARSCGLSPPASVSFHRETTVRKPDEELSPTCLAVWKRLVGAQFADRRQAILQASFWNIFSVFFATALSAGATVLGRDIRKEDNSWPIWSLRRIPFLRLFALATIPAFLGVCGVIGGSFLELWIKADLNLTENQILFFFQSKMVYFAMYTGMAFVMSVGVLILMDQHDRLSAAYTLPIGLLFAVFILAWSYLTVIASYGTAFLRPTPDGLWMSFEMREAIIFGAHPALFVLFFAGFLELTEDSETQKRYRARLFGRRPKEE